MLVSLNISNIVLIEKLNLEFGGGLNVLTGETGAGKSIVIDAINALLGERITRDVVRTGADRAYISGVFDDLPPEVVALLNELDLPPEEVPHYSETIHPDGYHIISDFTWGYRPVTNRNGQALYLRLSVAEHPNIVWDAAVYINDEGEYALRRRVYVRPSYAIKEPYAFKTDSYALYCPLSVSLDAFLPEGWDTPAETESETAP